MYLFTYLQIPQVKKIVPLMNVLKLLNHQATVEETAARWFLFFAQLARIIVGEIGSVQNNAITRENI